MNEELEKRMVQNYEITQGIRIGDQEVVFGVDEKSKMPYFCAFYVSNDILGSYRECMISDDYVEMTELFAERVKAQCVKTREKQEKVTVPREVITADMCFKAEVLRPEYRSADYQLIYVSGGNGASGKSMGSACFHTNLYSGERGRWERYDILGWEVKPECLPEWAKEKFIEIQKREIVKEGLNEKHNREVR